MPYAQSYRQYARMYTHRYPRRRARRIVIKVLLVVVAAVILLLGWFCVTNAAGLLAANPEQPALSGQNPPSAAPVHSVPLPVSDVHDTGFLRLINQEHPLGTEPDATGLQRAYPTLEVSSEDILLDEAAILATAKLAQAAQREQVGTLMVNSGYRSYSEQAQLYEEMLDKSYVQQPGNSEHHTGLAIDLVALEDNSGEDPSLAERWMASHSWRYGLLLRYPADKQEITQVAYEPWHFRYVGTPHAWYCWQNNLCLEEYIQLLRESGGYQTKLEDRIYYVYPAEVQDGVLYVPEGLSYEVSSDGAGGYIITAWK